MDLFGFMGNADLATPIGTMIKSGTDTLLLGPDWSRNIEICDAVSREKDGPAQATKAIYRRLLDNDQNTVYLTLIIFESCMKNCGTHFAQEVNKSLMDEMSNIARGSKGNKNSFEALRLIQEWGRAYEKKRGVFPLFYDTYMALKMKGLQFPKEDENSALIFEPTGSKTATSQRAVEPIAPKPAEVPQKNVNEVERLDKDLAVVMEKVRLCREMLPNSAGIEHDDTLAEVVGFLEACRDRMGDVIETGSMGLLGEDQFEQCLQVNDAIIRTLDAERNGTSISVDEELAKKGNTTNESKSSNNLLDLDSPVKPAATVEAMSGSDSMWKDDDVFGSIQMKSAGKIGSAASTNTSTKKIKPLQPPPSSSNKNSNSAPANTTNTDFLDMASISVSANLAPVSTPNPSNGILPPPAPANTATAPSANPFDLLDMAAEPPAPPSNNTTVAPASSNPMSESDFDAFFESLGKSNTTTN